MTGIQPREVAKAAKELARMRKSLAAWLKYRALNNRVLAGNLRPKVSVGTAQALVARARSSDTEAKLGATLYQLLSEVMPEAALPDPSRDPNATVKLALIALDPSQAAAVVPTAQEGFFGAPQPWLWPVLIVGGLLMAVTTAVRTYADVAKEEEHYACIRAGACTDYGFWLKAGAVVAGGWVVWEKMGVGEAVKKKISGGSKPLALKK